MPRTTETYDLREELEFVDNELDRLADEIVDVEEGTAKYNDLTREAQQREREYVGLQWALNPEDSEDRAPYEEVTLGSLTAGEYAHVMDVAQKAKQMASQHGSAVTGDNASQLYFVVEALVDAPWLDADDSFNQKAAKTRELAPHFMFFLEERADELTTPSVEGNGFAQRVAERKSATTSE